MGSLQLGDKPIAAPRDGLDERRIVGRITQGRPELPDRHVHGVVKVPKALFRPDARLQLLARDQIPRPLQQDLQDLERLVLELDPTAGLPHLASMEIGLERPKTNRRLPVSVADHARNLAETYLSSRSPAGLDTGEAQ